jgi:hypothetical protein
MSHTSGTDNIGGNSVSKYEEFPLGDIVGGVDG